MGAARFLQALAARPEWVGAEMALDQLSQKLSPESLNTRLERAWNNPSLLGGETKTLLPQGGRVRAPGPALQQVTGGEAGGRRGELPARRPGGAGPGGGACPRSQAAIGRRRACLHVPCGGGTTFKPGGGAGARREEAAARQLRGVGRGGGGSGGGGGGGGGGGPRRDGYGGLPSRPMEAAAAAAGGGCGSGPPLLLSEGEQQCYSELFARCAGAAGGGQGPLEAARTDPGAATAAAGPVADLFRASQLPAETLHQITELCGAKRVGYFGPTQFYVALKLIAAAQSGLPVRLESIKCELPLPRFVMSKNDGEIRFGNSVELHGTKVQIPYLTTEKNSFKRMDDGDKQPEPQASGGVTSELCSGSLKQEAQSPTMSPLASPPSSPLHYQRVPLSHGYSKLRSGAEQMHPAPYEARQPLAQPEGPSSGGPGAKPPRLQASLIRSFSVEREPQDNISNYPDEPWRITEEQREYYVNQFRSLQPDPSSFISGSVAKNFFTKSKLSIPELSYIWELSDADCDGALTLSEFCAAFHLIVARKNGYPLPECLPPTLQSEYLQAAFPKPKWECTLFDSYSESVPATQQPRDLNRIEKASVKDMADFPVPIQDMSIDDKQALKSTLDEALPTDVSEDPATPKDSNSLKARPRSRSYSSTSIEEAMKRGEDPPTPPPRPQKTHSRASSLDLNKVFQPTVPASKSGLLSPPPALPPRPCPSQVGDKFDFCRLFASREAVLTLLLGKGWPPQNCSLRFPR
ncbi:ralBP1-associated Eps domain-containing protein 2-like [Choloepus didactylus]|uniref:ralBP1-associated Eps domain-containing protein 2-like n=1 Tax=Choloepus didactylus TaxID=27675 RepID=UPI0018A0D014|nr:ralBP1-associated Eps domain-containing protein 2-like [Choloepus didactylus]